MIILILTGHASQAFMQVPDNWDVIIYLPKDQINKFQLEKAIMLKWVWTRLNKKKAGEEKANQRSW